MTYDCGHCGNWEETSKNGSGTTDKQNISGRQEKNRGGTASTLGKNQGSKEPVVRCFETLHVAAWNLIRAAKRLWCEFSPSPKTLGSAQGDCRCASAPRSSSMISDDSTRVHGASSEAAGCKGRRREKSLSVVADVLEADFPLLIVGGTPPFAKNGYGTERIGSKKDNLRGERRSSGSRASYRSRYERFSCTDMKFSRSIQFSQSRMVSGSSVPRSAVALMNVSSTFIFSKTSLSSAMNSSARPGLSGMSTSRVKRWPVI